MFRQYVRFLVRILKHKWWVLYFGLRIGGIPLTRLLMHDMSKFSRAEFMPRFRFQILKVTTFESAEFQACCDHHHARNPHHWQHWVFEGRAIPMPETYVREMVADWIAADKTYKKGVAPWLRSEWPQMNLNRDTAVRVIAILRSQGIAKESYFPEGTVIGAPTR